MEIHDADARSFWGFGVKRRDAVDANDCSKAVSLNRAGSVPSLSGRAVRLRFLTRSTSSMASSSCREPYDASDRRFGLTACLSHQTAGAVIFASFT